MVFKKCCYLLWAERLKISSSTVILILIFSQASKCSFEIEEAEGDVCPGGEGFYPDTSSCTKFYRCVETFHFMFAYEFNCPEGTVFDPDIKVCNHPYAVHPNYRCFISNLFNYKRIKHTIHVLNDNHTVLHKFVSSNELDIADE